MKNFIKNYAPYGSLAEKQAERYTQLRAFVKGFIVGVSTYMIFLMF